MADNRQVLVPPERLEGWVRRFGERNGPFDVENGPDGVTLTAENGCTAMLTPPWPGDDGPVSDPLGALLSNAAAPRVIGLLLIRRGGYAVGVAAGGTLTASKTGTKYVQSRTAAGGWSQQRFARRRSNQADALVDAAVSKAAEIFAGHSIDSIQLGGDRTLTTNALGSDLLANYAQVTKLPFLVVPDPRLAVLRQAAVDARSIRVDITGIPVS
ncbi:acVLRF1 family peptidyl-tRNA hydrolase [Arthrobacter sp. H5]|uniref:acVLRF1 family peptidyl-tRNA hydrolase n=1 Tax=Arthrobacter sp. H5 TaxID=1267973 RepID=UPI0004807F9F|nr:acVLRF1 family peptidyl-tRNA hydrolase [Arthrobacter sp. H5]